MKWFACEKSTTYLRQDDAGWATGVLGARELPTAAGFCIQEFRSFLSGAKADSIPTTLQGEQGALVWLSNASSSTYWFRPPSMLPKQHLNIKMIGDCVGYFVWFPGRRKHRLNSKVAQPTDSWCSDPIKPTSLLIAEVRPSWSPEISLNAKAWNGRVICSWLAETMCDAVEGPGYDAGNDPGRLAVLTSFALTLGLL